MLRIKLTSWSFLWTCTSEQDHFVVCLDPNTYILFQVGQRKRSIVHFYWRFEVNKKNYQLITVCHWYCNALLILYSSLTRFERIVNYYSWRFMILCLRLCKGWGRRIRLDFTVQTQTIWLWIELYINAVISYILYMCL